MKKCSSWYGQNSQLMHWWVLVPGGTGGGEGINIGDPKDPNSLKYYVQLYAITSLTT